jgi:HEAT repeat protein
VDGAVPVLAQADADTPLVLDALLAARADLGAPAGRSELSASLESRDPTVRAAAVRALARLPDQRALDDLSRYATLDQDVNVRVAAIEALGARKEPDAVPLLARTFGAEDRRIRQSSARALAAIGGPQVEQTLGDLAMHANSAETRKYAALVLLMTTSRDNPVVRQLAGSNPDPEIKHLIEHGLEFGDHHGE